MRGAGQSQKQRLQRALAHLVFRTRSWTNRNVEEIARRTQGKRILEVGSGRQDLGEDAFSVRKLFEDSNEFVQSDVVPEFGHEIVDITSSELENAFDMIICLYVLEHIYDVHRAVEGMHRALVPGGTAVIVVPHVYPYHDEPTDYWRFTEHALRSLLDSFSSVEIKHRGPRRMPLALFALATK